MPYTYDASPVQAQNLSYNYTFFRPILPRLSLIFSPSLRKVTDYPHSLKAELQDDGYAGHTGCGYKLYEGTFIESDQK